MTLRIPDGVSEAVAVVQEWLAAMACDVDDLPRTQADYALVPAPAPTPVPALPVIRAPHTPRRTPSAPPPHHPTADENRTWWNDMPARIAARTTTFRGEQ